MDCEYTDFLQAADVCGGYFDFFALAGLRLGVLRSSHIPSVLSLGNRHNADSFIQSGIATGNRKARPRHMMKATLLLIFLCLYVVGCSREGGAASGSLFEQLEAGKDLSFGCYVLHVNKCTGNSVQGIQMVRRYRGGQTETVTAKSGTLSEGPDPLSIRFMLQDGQIREPNMTMIFRTLTGVWSQSDRLSDYAVPASNIQQSSIVAPPPSPEFDSAQTNQVR